MEKKSLSEERRMYDTLLAAVESFVENYGSDEKESEIVFNIDSDPFPVRFRITVRPDNGIFTVLSQLDFEVPEENRAAYAAGLCALVYDELYVGAYDFSPESGITVFRVSEIYRTSLISKELCVSVMQYVYDTVSKYNERLFRLSRGE